MKLDALHLLVDAAKAGEPYTYGTLQEAAAQAADHATIYLAPDVYWTDDPADPNVENNLIGLTLTANNLTLIGLGATPEETVICGDRGQMHGSIGNWNTLGIAGSDFQAENITFGNYCNVDLEYAPDPSKNHKKRTDSITQAQVIIPVGAPDRWTFTRCRFISMLNVFSYNRQMGRIYYKDCFFQSTDDSIGSGDVNVFENCHFVWYSNHPSGSACETLLVYAGCHFEGRLLYPDFDSTVYLSKAQHRTIAMLDCSISGNVTGVKWNVNPHEALRCYTYHNTFVPSWDRPECSVILEKCPLLLQAFKVGDQYNIWNLLRGEDNWDPCGQKDTMAPFGEIPWRVRLTPAQVTVPAGGTIEIAANQYWHSGSLTWRVEPEDWVTCTTCDRIGKMQLTNQNPHPQQKTVKVQAITPQGLEGVAYYTLDYIPVAAPKLIGEFNIVREGNRLKACYELDGAEADASKVYWYRASNGERAQAIPVAAGKGEYHMSCRDNGWFLLAAVAPQTICSVPGPLYWSEPIWVDEVDWVEYHTDFTDLPLTEELAETGPSDVPEYPMKPLRNGFWQIGAGRALDYPDKFQWYPKSKPSKPWTYGTCGEEGQEATGLMTTHRGSRLLFPQAEKYACQEQH